MVKYCGIWGYIEILWNKIITSIQITSSCWVVLPLATPMEADASCCTHDYKHTRIGGSRPWETYSSAIISPHVVTSFPLCQLSETCPILPATTANNGNIVDLISRHPGFTSPIWKSSSRDGSFKICLFSVDLGDMPFGWYLYIVFYDLFLYICFILE